MRSGKSNTPKYFSYFRASSSKAGEPQTHQYFNPSLFSWLGQSVDVGRTTPILDYYKKQLITNSPHHCLHITCHSTGQTFCIVSEHQRLLRAGLAERDVRLARQGLDRGREGDGQKNRSQHRQGPHRRLRGQVLRPELGDITKIFFLNFVMTPYPFTYRRTVK